MSVHVDFHIRGYAASVRSFRASGFVTLDLFDGDGASAAVYFADRAELLAWLADASEAAAALPGVPAEVTG